LVIIAKRVFNMHVLAVLMVYLNAPKVSQVDVLIAPRVISAPMELPIMNYIHVPEVVIVQERLNLL
jgi:hypothetical protein